jgi:hypothetical protein
MSQHDGGSARGDRRSEGRSRVDGSDPMLGTDRDDVSAGDVMVAVEEERCEVFAVREAHQGVKRSRGGIRLGDDGLREP